MAVHSFLIVEGYMPVEIRYVESNALSPLTGYAKIYSQTKDPFTIGEPLALTVYELDDVAGTWEAVDFVSDVYVKRQNSITTDENYYQIEIDFEDSVEPMLEEEIYLDSTYFDSNKGITPSAVADAIMVGAAYNANILPVLLVDPLMKIRDFQFKGTRLDAINKFERCIGGRAIIDRDNLKLKFVPAYYDTTRPTINFGAFNIYSPLHEESTYIVSDGVEITGMLNAPSTSATSIAKAYRLGNDCWAVWLNTSPTESAQGNTIIEGWLRANINFPDVINTASPSSSGITDIRVDGTLVDIPVWGPSDFSTLTGEPNSDFVVVTGVSSLEFYRKVDLVVDAPDIMSQMTNAYLAAVAKKEKSCDFQFQVSQGNLYNTPFTKTAGSTPREIIQSNEPCTLAAAQRCADIKSQGKGYQWETIIEPDSSAVFRPGSPASYGGDSFIIEEVSVTSPPYSIRIKLLEEVT
jgi:hypothetical protein